MGDFGIKLNNKTFLDLYPNTSFSYVLNSPFYLGGELGDPIAGNLIFSVKVPINAHNNKLLRFPGLIDNAWKWIEKADCSVYTEGVAVWFGTLDIIAPSTEREANIRITINSAATLQTLKMNELDLGHFNTVANNPYEWANQTVTNPDATDFLFAPVWNPDFWLNQARKHEKNEMQNLWVNNGFGSTPDFTDKPSLTPFPKLNFVLEKIAASAGYRLSNAFQTTRELKRLILYTNASMTAKDGERTAINFSLSYGLSDTTTAVFLRQLCRKYALGPFFDAESLTLELIPFKDIYKSNTAHNWTKKQLSGYEINAAIEFPSVLTDKFSDTIVNSNVRNLASFDEHPADIDGPEGVYRINGLTYYHKNLIPTGTTLGLRQLSQARLDDEVPLSNAGGKRYESDLGTLILSRLTRNEFLDYPSLSQRGKAHGEAHVSENTTANRLLFYRGIGRNNYPFATNEDRDMLGYHIKNNGVGFDEYDVEHTLDWAGAKGTYNNFWKENHQVVANGKQLRRKIALTINDLQGFSFKNKVRLDNQECFVKKISGVLNRRGLQPADVDFVTVT